jgi:hypothetical protein
MEDNTTNFRAPPRRVDHTYRDYSLFLERLPKDKKGSTNFPAKLHRILSNPDEYSHVRRLQTNIVGPILRRLSTFILYQSMPPSSSSIFFFFTSTYGIPLRNVTYWILQLFFSDHIMDGKKIISHIVFCWSNPSPHLRFLYFVCTAAW